MLKKQKYLDESAFKRLLYAVRTRPHKNSLRDFALFAVAGLCGLRSVEVTTIQVGDCSKLKEEPPRLDVRTAKQRSKDGHPPIDEVTVPKTAAYSLKKWIGKLPKTSPSDLVFQVQTRQLRRLFRHYARLAGIDDSYSFHSLRHFRGVQLYTKYRDIVLVKESLRHRRITTTEIYVVAVEASERQAACDIEIEGET
jgi:integrase